MDAVPNLSPLEAVLDFVLSRPTLEEIIAFRVPDAIDARLHDLLDRSSRDQLTLDEQSELDEFIQIGHMLRMLKAKARLKLVDTE